MIRPAKIQRNERHGDHEYPVVGCVRVYQFEHDGHPGQLVHVCPGCLKVHFHGGTGPTFGDGDGHRLPHCVGRHAPCERGYILEEVEDIDQAGNLPAKLKREAKRVLEERKRRRAQGQDV